MERRLCVSFAMAVGLVTQIEVGAEGPTLDACVDDRRLDGDADQGFEQTWLWARQCAAAARAIVSAGTDADRERVWFLFDQLPEDSPVAGEVLDAFLDRHVARALAGLDDRAPPTVSEAPSVDAEIPDFLKGGPAELQQAWRAYQAVVHPPQKATDGSVAGEPIAFLSNQAAFRGMVAGFLRGRIPAAEAARELSRYQWAGWCGMGSGLLYGPRSKALLLAYLELGRVDLAVAVSDGLMLEDGQADRWDRRLLAAAGIDWERFYLGGVLSGQADLAAPLARNGSERAARQLLAAARLLDARERESSDVAEEPPLWALAALVEPSGSCGEYGRSDSREVVRDREAEPIGRDVQADVLELFAGRVGPDAGLGEADAASHLLVRLCRPESLPAFRVMLESPYDEVRRRGALGLRALGETVADPPRSRPVAFRILVDGKAAGQREVRWTLESADQGEDSSTATADEEGMVRLSRDPFLDPRRPVTSVRLEAPLLASAGDMWFSARLDRPPDLDATVTVSVLTGSLTVVVPPSLLTGTEGRPPTLRLSAETARDGIEAMPVLVAVDLPVVSSRITFPRLQQGHYQVWLSRGAHLHMSPTVDVGEGPATVTVSETNSVRNEFGRSGYHPPDTTLSAALP